jgi:hypothetical protein
MSTYISRPNVHFTKDDAHSEKKANEFKQWLYGRIDIFNVLGDFPA